MKRAGSAPSLTPQLYKIRAQELLFFSLPSKYECHLFTIILIYSPSKQNFLRHVSYPFLQIVYITIPYEDTPLPPVQFALTVI